MSSSAISTRPQPAPPVATFPPKRRNVVPRPSSSSSESDNSDSDDDDNAPPQVDGTATNTGTATTTTSSSASGGKIKSAKAAGGKGGSSCHQCKSRRNLTALTYCTSTLDKKKKRCRKKFCHHCLKKFYRETAATSAADKAAWKCPSCRRICCCAACRRRKMKEAGVHGGGTGIDGAAGEGVPGAFVGGDDVADRKRAKTASAAGASSMLAHLNDEASPDFYPHFDTARTARAFQLPSDDSLFSSAESPIIDANRSTLISPQLDASASLLFTPHLTPIHQTGSGTAAVISLKRERSSDSLPSPALSPSNTSASAGGDVDSSQFHQLLTKHIRTEAERARSHGQTSALTRMWRVCLSHTIKRKIQSVLTRTDVSKERKVEMIATMLTSVT